MKKSKLLFALLLAILGQGVIMAQTYDDNGDAITAETLVLKPGESKDLKLYLTRKNSTNFTNIQFNIEFPQGIYPEYSETWDAYGWHGDDEMATKYLQFATNFDMPEYYPNHTVVVVNFTKTRITSNPCQFFTMRVHADEAIECGSYPIKVSNIKYTDYDNAVFESAAEQQVCEVLVDDTPVVAEYGIHAESQSTRKGEQCVLKIGINTPEAVTLWQTDIVLPAGFTVATDSWGDPAIAISGSRTNPSRHSIASQMQPDGSLRVISSSMNNNVFVGSVGEVAAITLNVAGDVETGKYPVIFKNTLLVEPNEAGHFVDQSSSDIEVRNYVLGDVNDDGRINGTDLVGVANFILEHPLPTDIFWAADVVPDGVINGSDYVREVNAVLGRITLSSKSQSKAPAVSGNYEIYSQALSADPGSEVELKVCVKNDTPFTLWQSDFVIPECVSVTDVAMSGARTNEQRHEMLWSMVADGTMRVLCVSNSNREFAGNDAEVAVIKLKVADDAEAGEYVIDFNNGLVVESNEASHQVDNTHVVLMVNETTGVKELGVENGPVNVYNACGQLVRRGVERSIATQGLQQGIYIVGNKKVVIK